MNTHEQLAHFYKNYITTLKVKSPIHFFHSNTNITFSCSSRLDRKEHWIVCPHYVNTFEDWTSSASIPGVVHELCHLHIAEQIDYAFAGVVFPKSKIPPDDIAQRLIILVQWIDLWVNEVRHKHWPELTSANLNSFIEVLNPFYFNHYIDDLQRVVLAVLLCEIDRFSLENELLRKGICLYAKKKDQEVIMKLEALYKTLPPLAYDQESSRNLLLKFNQATAQILGYDKPNMIFEQGEYKWHF